MLQHLQISNYALIDTLELSLGAGFNVITGETGAGKSIILGALGLLLGGRADSRVVTDKERKSVVEGIFGIADTDTQALEGLFKTNNLDWDPEAITLRREIAGTTGRSRAFVNDTPVTVEVLAQIARYLVDIHSQHQNQLLATPEYQLDVLDALADNSLLLDSYRDAYAAFVDARRRYEQQKAENERQRQDQEYLQASYKQLDDMHLQKGEQLALEEERTLLANAADILEAHGAITTALQAEETGALTSLSNAISQCRRLSETLPAVSKLIERLENVQGEVSDIVDTLNRQAEKVNADPARLAAVEQRLDDIYTLLHRYKVSTSDDLMIRKDVIAAQLNNITSGEELLQIMHESAQTYHRQALAMAREISERRRQAAEDFAKLLVETAAPLGMARLQCDIHLDTLRQLSPTGIDKVDMRFAFNLGQPPMSVGATASGGEVSRLMLAIKSLIAAKVRIPTLIFDEVDTGVSGDIAVRMGRMMATISHKVQVMAITHLPQVAALGTAHYKVFKRDNDTATRTHLVQLTDEERVTEIATMIGGDATAPHALATAKAMLAGTIEGSAKP